MLHDNDDGECTLVTRGKPFIGSDALPGGLKEPAKMTAEEQAEAHWKYVEGVLEVHKVNPIDIKLVGHHYRTAFIHGWKHAEEAANGND